MWVTLSQYMNELKPKLFELGYSFINRKDEGFLELNNNQAWFPDQEFEHSEALPIVNYDPDLFIALAAMSKGPDHYPGEFVKYVDSKQIYKVVLKDEFGNYHIKNEYTNFTTEPSNLTKATKEEIIAWFTKDDKPKTTPLNGDYVSVDRVNPENGDLLERLYGTLFLEHGGGLNISIGINTFMHIGNDGNEKLDSGFTNLRLASNTTLKTAKPIGFNPDAGNPHTENDYLRGDGKTVRLREKPPLGIPPRKLHEETRIRTLIAAIDGYLTEGLNIPEAWRDELNDLLYSRSEPEVEA